MRLLVDYRPALRARTGVGEWTHQLVRALLDLPPAPGMPPLDVHLFVSSWKDRPDPASVRELPAAQFHDVRVPVRLLTFLWNRLGWPPAERLIGVNNLDVSFSPTPLLLPSRASLRIVTVHDLDFLDHPDRTTGEMRRDFPSLAGRHVAAADLVVAVSHFTATETMRRLSVQPDKLVVCRPGVPAWLASAPPRRGSDGQYLLFVGTLEPRKNVPGLIDAYERLLNDSPKVVPLVLAGPIPEGVREWLTTRLAGRLERQVHVRGYIPPEERPSLYAGARALILPSHMEGFGLPVLEAMSAGVPVIVSDRGALPEVAGRAGTVVPVADTAALAAAMAAVLRDADLADRMADLGREQARQFSWRAAAATLDTKLREVLARRAGTTRGRA